MKNLLTPATPTTLCAALFVSLFVVASSANAVAQDAAKQDAQHIYADGDVIRHYTTLVYANYTDAYRDARAVQKAINTFLGTPTDANLSTAKQAWLVARDTYGQTEAFRFYEGPIDFVDDNRGVEGPEGRLNAWPLNEAYIDYVKGNKKAGIVQARAPVISKKSLKAKNQENDEADVSTGYHAIEFLLWGQDLNLASPGQRPVSDYAKTTANERRRTYLKAVTDLLVDDLHFLVKSWQPEKNNYAKTFIKDPDALGKILTALATLSGFELASERLATALDSGDQEDEHSCFSDNTHNDFIMNAKGVTNVYFGTYNNIEGPNIHNLVKARDATLAKRIADQLKQTERLIAAIPAPIDRALLATPQGSRARVNAEKAVTSLQQQADLFKHAGKVLGFDVKVMSD